MATEHQYPVTRANFLLQALPHVISAVQGVSWSQAPDVQGELQAIHDHVYKLKSRIRPDEASANERSEGEKELIALIFRALGDCEGLLYHGAFKADDLSTSQWRVLEALQDRGVQPSQPNLLLDPDMPDSEREARLRSLVDISKSLGRIAGQEPPRHPGSSTGAGSASADQVRILRARRLVDRLLCGMERALECDCGQTDVHGALLFLDPHPGIDDNDSDKDHEFRLLVSHGVPDIEGSAWLQFRASVDGQQHLGRRELAEQGGLVCRHMQHLVNINDTHSATRVNLVAEGLRARPYAIPQDTKTKIFRDARRVGLQDLLSDHKSGASLPKKHQFQMALLFILSTAYLSRGTLLRHGLSKDHICFLQDERWLRLQPFVFSWFSPSNGIPPGANLGSIHDSGLLGLAILLTETLFHINMETRISDQDKEDSATPIMLPGFYTVSRLCASDDDVVWTPFESYQAAVQACVDASANPFLSEESYVQFLVEQVLEPISREYEAYLGEKQPLDWAALQEDLVSQKVHRIVAVRGGPVLEPSRPIFDNIQEMHQSAGDTNTLIREMASITANIHNLGISTAAKVAVLDTGLNAEHFWIKDCTGRITQENFFDPGDDATLCPDNDGHGTFIAAMLTRMTGGRQGRTRLYFGKVLDARISPSHPRCIAAIEKGIEWAIRNEVDIISLSFGYHRYSFKAFENIRKAIDRAHRVHGIIVIAAASNDRRRKSPAWPASVAEHVMCANSANSDDARSWFNPPTGPGNDIFMHAEKITSAWPGPGNRCQSTQSGTSWAAPALAAMAALLIEVVDDYVAGLGDGGNVPRNRERIDRQKQRAEKIRDLRGMSKVLRELCSLPEPKKEATPRFVVRPSVVFDWETLGNAQQSMDNTPSQILQCLEGVL